jgi:hypothetical protein
MERTPHVSRVRSGDGASILRLREELAAVQRELRALQLTVAPPLAMQKGPGGTALSMVSRYMLPAKITSGGPGVSYTGNIYANGPTADATLTGVTIKICQLDTGQTVPANTWLMVTKIGLYYYGQIPIWL